MRHYIDNICVVRTSCPLNLQGQRQDSSYPIFKKFIYIYTHTHPDITYKKLSIIQREAMCSF